MDNVIGMVRTAGPAREQMLKDLEASGLSPSDVNARVMENPERAALKVEYSTNGYIIPYYDISGKILPFYRARLFDVVPKYRQPKDTPTYVYFPRSFLELTSRGGVVFLTEGEKKATLACKLGYATAALGGVDAWRNRTLTLPGDTELEAKGSKKALIAKVDDVTEDVLASLAVGMQDLIDVILQKDLTLIIVFDSDKSTGIKPSVQRAAASLGFELRSKGVPFSRIRQLILPFSTGDDDASTDKVGLDDFLQQDGGTETFEGLVKRTLEKRSAFPRHPSIQDYVGKRLQRRILTRKENQHIAMAVLSELDALGIRLRDADAKQMYYFDFRTRRLMKAGFLYGKTDEAHDTPFGSLLYQRFGIGAADQRVLEWLSAQFNGEPPIEHVSPERVIARPIRDADSVHLQLSDGEYCTVDGEGLSIKDNGADGILFEEGHVAPIDARELARAFQRQEKAYTAKQPNGLDCWWMDVLNDVRLKDHNRGQEVLALLYYVSPWLNRWRGTQLPVELILGESGSGKSTLAETRLSIITGIPRLRNRPTDQKDWYAIVSNAGGLLCVDNVQLADKTMRDTISDELCRIVTEPNPAIEMRKYYTNAEIVRFPVRTTFALTAIKQPFQNQDILQRSVIVELDKPADPNVAVSFDHDWTRRHLEARGGRVAWVAHHLYALHLFFKAIKHGAWTPTYRAKHRLINLEQSLAVMGKVFGWDPSKLLDMPEYLATMYEGQLDDTDWTFEGLRAYVDEFKRYHPNHGANGPFFTCQQIASWAEEQEEYKKSEQLTQSRKLGKYFATHKSTLASVLGIVEAGMTQNRNRYKILPLRKQGRPI